MSVIFQAINFFHIYRKYSNGFKYGYEPNNFRASMLLSTNHIFFAPAANFELATVHYGVPFSLVNVADFYYYFATFRYFFVYFLCSASYVDRICKSLFNLLNLHCIHAFCFMHFESNKSHHYAQSNNFHFSDYIA